jgi:hypothetical protein
MPDFWGDNAQDLSLFPLKIHAQTKLIMDFFDSGLANPKKTAPLIPPLLENMKKQHPEIEESAIMGFCWGGKMAALFAVNGGFFKAAVQYHPSLLDVENAKNMTIPVCVLTSMDEDVAVSFAPLHSLLIIGTTGRGDLVRFVR